jgi:D-alanine transaminase
MDSVTKPMRPTLANWNGELSPLEDVKVSVLDRAFLFGDAVYEAMRIYGGQAWLADEHFARFRRSLSEIHIVADVDRLRGRMEETLRASGVEEGLVYLHVTRGQGPRSHAWKSPMTPNELIWVQDYGGDPFADRRPVGTGVVVVPDRRWGRPDVKSVNLLANCMACQIAYEAGCIEAVLVDDADLVTEATHSSFFAVLDGVVRTSPNDVRVLPGVTRNWVVDRLHSIGRQVDETPIAKSDLSEAEELFLTGTSIEVMPVIAVDGRPVGSGKPGPITRKLMQEYQAAVEEFRKAT